MKNRDLQSIIRDMATRLDVHHQPGEAPVASGFYNEVEAYMSVDATLARLYKEFLDARRTRVRALEQQGEGSAMSEIARDLEESAQSAMETRMIELREDRMKKAMVERMMAHASMTEMDAYRSEKAKWYADRQAEYFAQERRDDAIAAKRQQDGEDSFLTLMMMWWMMRQMVRQTQVRLSLAKSFARALNNEHEYATNAA
jgi:hypothetical protein